VGIEIHLTLRSDATFGRGDGVAGLIDQEIEHDTATGLPFIRGRTLKGLLVEECANILYALELQQSSAYYKFKNTAKSLFGQAGSTLDDDGVMHVGSALLPEELRQAVDASIKQEELKLKSDDVLSSLTTIRRQTAVNEETGAPEETTLRSMRVLLRETELTAQLYFNPGPDREALALLAACALLLRRGGTGRNRGRGRIKVELYDGKEKITTKHFADFKELLAGDA
jgi:CRISPR/Cas system CMR subunit Cmr4 (Cas7 group RAMP superfamily)